MNQLLAMGGSDALSPFIASATENAYISRTWAAGREQTSDLAAAAGGELRQRANRSKPSCGASAGKRGPV
jgi:hypothetical protein